MASSGISQPRNFSLSGPVKGNSVIGKEGKHCTCLTRQKYVARVVGGLQGRYQKGPDAGNERMAFESYMVVLFGAVIVVQQFIMYLMYVRIRQLLTEINAIEGKIKITDHELDSLIQKVEEFKRSNL